MLDTASGHKIKPFSFRQLCIVNPNSLLFVQIESSLVKAKTCLEVSTFENGKLFLKKFRKKNAFSLNQSGKMTFKIFLYQSTRILRITISKRVISGKTAIAYFSSTLILTISLTITISLIVASSHDVTLSFFSYLSLTAYFSLRKKSSVFRGESGEGRKRQKKILEREREKKKDGKEKDGERGREKDM